MKATSTMTTDMKPQALLVTQGEYIPLSKKGFTVRAVLELMCRPNYNRFNMYSPTNSSLPKAQMFSANWWTDFLYINALSHITL